MICHVYRRGGLYWAKLQLDWEARLSRFPLGTSDKRVAQAKLHDEATKREKIHTGMLPSDSVLEAAAKPISELLAAFLEDLQVKGRAPMTVVKYDNSLTKLFGRCRWRVLADMSARSFCEWRTRCGLSAKSLNDLLAAVGTFTQWLQYQRLASENPLRFVQRIDTRGRGRQYRRAFTAEELRKLLEAAPSHRRIVYLTAAYTGLRRSEMRALRWTDVVIEGPSPFIRVRACMVGNKSRKDAVLPLHPELVAALRVFRPEHAAPFSPVLAGLVPRIPTFRKDLVRAGVSFVDEQGRRGDLHSLRMTYGTNLTLSGAAPRVVQELMRHSDIKLTMKIYTDAAQLPLADAVGKLLATGAKTLCPEVCPKTCPNGGLLQSQGVAS